MGVGNDSITSEIRIVQFGINGALKVCGNNGFVVFIQRNGSKARFLAEGQIADISAVRCPVMVRAVEESLI